MTAAKPTATGIPGYTETVPCEPESACRARLLVSAALSTWGIGELAEAGTLVVSELITNAVNHTRCRVVRVVIRRETAEVVRIGVADKCRATPEPADPDNDSEDGRGLLLVESLSWRWGYDLHRWGKLVWAELRVPASC
ncbi:serine/threonine protein phosphatase [Streptomyces cellostaticus]|uniref:Serine/threonine protein phosphatase n=1 Tax=Streptomyces cellostaticus TaxID=67285 RepID=A0A101NLA2_9ACTN|nr:ATP-binding protein [Streptomyces cellostaticus]KUM95112.1 serine/threonine protein phosphatase [Streptomyces cellostaticus]